jgi:peptide/nickel transport system permease protein
MLSYFLRRVLLAIVTIWVISMISFVIILLPPGDFIDAWASRQKMSGMQINDQTVEALRKQYGLDKPAYVQYVIWMEMVLRGEPGYSLYYNQPVREVIGDRLSLTVVVSLGAEILVWLLALPIGIYSAVKQYSIGDYIFTILGFIGVGVPSFLLALIFMYLGFVWFGGDIGGLFSQKYMVAPWNWDRVVDLLKHLPLPALVLGLAGTAQMIRVMRANLLDELRKPYVITARAKGLSEMRLILKYPVRVALNPFVSTIGYLLPYIVSGSIIVSVVMSLPTVGPVLLTALLAQDMYLGGTIILMLSVLTVIGTLLSDLLLIWVDPRIRVEGR